jgi:hypothetical protein
VTEFMGKGSLIDYLRSRGRSVITRKDQINFARWVADYFETFCKLVFQWYLQRHGLFRKREVCASWSGRQKRAH